MLAAGAALHYAYLLSKGETRAVIKTDEGEMRCCVSRVWIASLLLIKN
jgi:hypothetical protein